MAKRFSALLQIEVMALEGMGEHIETHEESDQMKQAGQASTLGQRL
jgi:hypothetical protein